MRGTDKVTDIAIKIALLLILIAGAYALWDARQVYDTAEAANYTAFKPEPGEVESPGFKELKEINPDVFAWLTVNETPIDYPICQTTNNDKYISTDAEGNYSLSGAIFLDYRNDPAFTDFNSILYGHHMEKQQMFGCLSDFAYESYFNSHPYGNLYYNGQDHGLELFALILTDAYDKDFFTPALQGEEEQQRFLDIIAEKAVLQRDIPISLEDRIVLLSTCTSTITNGRYLLAGRITDEIYPAPKKEEVKIVRPPRRGTGTEHVFSRFASIPVYLWFIALFVLLILLLLLYLVKRSYHSENGEHNYER